MVAESELQAAPKLTRGAAQPAPQNKMKVKLNMSWITGLFKNKAQILTKVDGVLKVADRITGYGTERFSIEAGVISGFNPLAGVLFTRIAGGIHNAEMMLPDQVDKAIDPAGHDAINAAKHATAADEIMGGLGITYAVLGKTMSAERLAQMDKAISGMKDVTNFMAGVQEDFKTPAMIVAAKQVL